MIPSDLPLWMQFEMAVRSAELSMEQHMPGNSTLAILDYAKMIIKKMPKNVRKKNIVILNTLGKTCNALETKGDFYPKYQSIVEKPSEKVTSFTESIKSLGAKVTSLATRLPREIVSIVQKLESMVMGKKGNNSRLLRQSQKMLASLGLEISTVENLIDSIEKEKTALENLRSASTKMEEKHEKLTTFFKDTYLPNPDANATGLIEEIKDYMKTLAGVKTSLEAAAGPIAAAAPMVKEISSALAGSAMTGTSDTALASSLTVLKKTESNVAAELKETIAAVDAMIETNPITAIQANPGILINKAQKLVDSSNMMSGLLKSLQSNETALEYAGQSAENQFESFTGQVVGFRNGVRATGEMVSNKAMEFNLPLRNRTAGDSRNDEYQIFVPFNDHENSDEENDEDNDEENNEDNDENDDQRNKENDGFDENDEFNDQEAKNVDKMFRNDAEDAENAQAVNELSSSKGDPDTIMKKILYDKNTAIEEGKDDFIIGRLFEQTMNNTDGSVVHNYFMVDKKGRADKLGDYEYDDGGNAAQPIRSLRNVDPGIVNAYLAKLKKL